ncbi:MAG: KpsF/GutQ family sugar-phosphate isomerase [Alphaproteobacteria bacterium]|nr:KpsF/GutQ family sugar-phosphate isomerase [Alphaproteobacteria bacterium]MBV9061771.1 KpsF/GutQ family sugar-phosphate isomerase [Alphaproteobacteria bacterium]
MDPSVTLRRTAICDEGSHPDLIAARRVLDFAGEALEALAISLNRDFVRAVDTILGVKGRVIVSGMGKSGLIARKVAATFASTGTPAHFVHPAEASHGDLGALIPGDALLMMSWGGETAELSDLITYAKRFRIPLIAMAANPDSSLIQAADVKLLLPQSREACPMGLAPTTSTTLMLVLGDALAVSLMERRGFSADQYRELHPGGSLGRALIRVSDLMHVGEEIPLAAESDSMQHVLIVMAARRFGCVGITDKRGGLIGIVTDGDLSRHMSRDILDKSATDLMTRHPKIAAPDQLAAEALASMNDNKITRLFVLDPNDSTKRPIGILHIHDCLKAGIS